jgi:hypothetical protein
LGYWRRETALAADRAGLDVEEPMFLLGYIDGDVLMFFKGEAELIEAESLRRFFRKSKTRRTSPSWSTLCPQR